VGDDDAVATFIERLKRGPLSARIDRVEVAEATAQGFERFEITR
jgi:acylphosphatase